MKYLPIVLVLMSAVLLFVSSCGRSTPGSLSAVVINRTNEKFTNVSLNGRGYPGQFGNLVSGGNKVMYYHGSNVENQFEVVWQDNAGLQKRLLVRPVDFGRNREHQLIVEFTSDGNVKAYTDLAPWAKKKN